MSVILEAFLNTLWQTGAIALLAWAALRWTPRINAATRGAVWWAVLAFVVLLPVIRGMRELPGEGPAPRPPLSAPVSESAAPDRGACTPCRGARPARTGAGHAALRFVDHVVSRGVVRVLCGTVRPSGLQLPTSAPSEGTRAAAPRGNSRPTSTPG